MNSSDDPRRKTPADRFRRIIASDENKEATASQRRYPKATVSPTLNLPRAGSAGDLESTVPTTPVMVREPGLYREGGRSFLPAFWTAASIISLIFNVILLIFVVSLLRMLGSLNAASLGPGLLGGLYSNFELMDQAHIKTSIPIQTTIPLDLTVPVQSTTTITLAKEASIPGAHVKITTGGINIDAPANITLPAGTTLDVGMSFDLPVKSQVPVNLEVPVDIAVQNTELHPAIVGLQDTLRPLYCMVTPGALTLSGEPVCR